MVSDIYALRKEIQAGIDRERELAHMLDECNSTFKTMKFAICGGPDTCWIRCDEYTANKIDRALEKIESYVEGSSRVAEVAAALRDAERYRYIRDVLTRLASLKMDGQHYWHFYTLKVGRGPTFDAAIDMEMHERPIVERTEVL